MNKKETESLINVIIASDFIYTEIKKKIKIYEKEKTKKGKNKKTHAGNVPGDKRIPACSRIRTDAQKGQKNKTKKERDGL